MASRQELRLVRAACSSGAQAARVFAQDVARGFFEVTHNVFALLGLLIAGVVLFGAGRADIRHEAETQVLGWLKARQEARLEPVAPVRIATLSRAEALPDPTLDARDTAPDAIGRANGFDMKDLNRPQTAVALWLARRYKVAPEPVGALVKEAWQAGGKAGLDPTLILAIMAVESSFNPFAQSAVGAQGLMQVMTKVHNAKYVAFGGTHAAFDPLANLRVGVEVLKECISRAGSLEAGLRYYVGAGSEGEDGGYAGKVLSEQHSLKQVVGGKAVPLRTPLPPAAVSPAKRESVPAVAEEAPPQTPEQVALLAVH